MPPKGKTTKKQDFKCKTCGEGYNDRDDMIECFKSHREAPLVATDKDLTYTAEEVEKLTKEAVDKALFDYKQAAVIPAAKCPAEMKFLPTGRWISVKVHGWVTEGKEIQIEEAVLDR